MAALWGSRGKKPGTDLVVATHVVQQAPPPREEYDGADFIWRCGRCGAMGTSRSSMASHLGKLRCPVDAMREYVPREVYKEEYEATAQEISASGIWIVVKMPDDTPEGSIYLNRYREKPWDSIVLDGRSGLEAIQKWYSQQIADLGPKSTEDDREEANGRYVAIDFFTGHRAEALVESEWRANVEVAEGSDV